MLMTIEKFNKKHKIMVNTYHPLFVHFPIALLVIAGIVALVNILQSKYQLKNVILWNLTAGTLGAAIAVFSGFRDAGVIPHNETIHEILEVHEKIGIAIFVLSALLSIWFFIRRIKMKKIENILFVLVLWLGIGLVGYAGYLGGKMVYDNGAGIKPMQKTFPVEEHEHNE